MDPGEREQLRRDLRERGGWARDGEGRAPGRGSEPPGRGRGNPDPSRGDPRRDRLSENEREQLRRQLREQGRRRD